MTKLSEVAKRIVELRKAPPEMPRQQDLADAIGVHVSAVSAWESGKSGKGYAPKPDNYLRLASVAAQKGLMNEAIWFFERAGFDSKSLALISGRVLKAGPKEQVESLLHLIPATARQIVIDEKSAGGLFSIGDIIFVQESPAGAPWPGGFVLAEAPNGMKVGQLSVRQISREFNPMLWGLFLDGTELGRYKHPGPKESEPVPGSRRAELIRQRPAIADKVHALYQKRGGGVLAGREEKDYTDLEYKLRVLDNDIRNAFFDEQREAEKEGRRVAADKIRLSDGVRIVGRIVAWFPKWG